LRDPEAKAGWRRRRQVHIRQFFAGHDGVGLRTAGDGARQRPDRVERVAERERALGRNAKPTTPQSAAGIRTEPPVSLPIAISHMPSATATAAPEDEPPGTRARS